MISTFLRSVCVAVALVSLVWVARGRAVEGTRTIALPSDAEIRQMLAERLGPEDRGIGVVVGVISPQGRRVVSYGRRGQGDPRPLDGDTAFEIGSVTKVLTALLLADMVRQGEAALVDPVAKYLPAGTRVPQRNGHSINLLDLATHTSGLPFMPGGAFDDSTTASASTARLYQFLAGSELPREIGAEWEYSNLGYWLLGEALAARAGTGYEALLQSRVLGPLGMAHTTTRPDSKLEANLAVGHDASFERAPYTSSIPIFAAMPAAGGIFSTANDLLKLLGVAMGYEHSTLKPSLEALLHPRRPMPGAGAEQALGWVVMGKGSDPWVVHDGGTFGFSSSVAWDPEARVGIVVLSNQVTGVGDIARHLLRPEIPLAKPLLAKRTEIALDGAVLDTYVGQYEARGEGAFHIAREGDFLTFVAPESWGLPKLRLRPESRRGFFTAELPLRVVFEADASGRVTGVLIHPPRGQKAVPAGRVPPG